MKKFGTLFLCLNLLIGPSAYIYAGEPASFLPEIQLLLLKNDVTVPDGTFLFFNLTDDQPQTAGEDKPFISMPHFDKLDVHFNMDTTGSMEGEIANLQAALTDPIMTSIDGLVPDAAFSVSSYRDFPVSTFGDPGDYPFRLDHRITTDLPAVQTALNTLTAQGGGDLPESGFESLFQIAVGAGGVSWSGGSIAPFDPSGGEGSIGGAGFREGSLPVVVHITDVTSHSAADYGSWVSGEHSRAQAVAGLNSIGARFIGITSGQGGDELTEMLALAQDTDSVVLPCVFEAAGCTPNSCCIGLSGAEVSPVEGACPLVFQVDSDGNGLSTAVVDAIDYLTSSITRDVTIRVVRDESVFPGVDTACFVQTVTPLRFEGAPTCGPTPVILYNGFGNVSPGTQLFLEVTAQNNGCVTPSSVPKVFVVHLEILGDDVTVLKTLHIAIRIPPAS